jgi:hypothetical protein
MDPRNRPPALRHRPSRPTHGANLEYFALIAILLAACIDEPKPSTAPFEDRTLALAPVRYEINLDIDYEEEKLSGKARLTLRNNSDLSVRHLPLLLYRLMTVRSATGEGGMPLSFEQRVLAFEDWEQMQANYVEVALPTPIDPGQVTHLDLEWDGFLAGYTETGMMYVKDSINPEFTMLRPDALAYPKPGYPNWEVNSRAGLPEFDYALRVTVPEGLTVANAGRLVRQTASNGRTTFAFESTIPSWRIDIAIAPYDVIDQDGVRIYHFPEDRAGARLIGAEFERAMQTFTDWFGALDEFRGFTIIEIPAGHGSQTDKAAIIQTADAFRDKASLNQFYHEASHLWNVVATDRPAPRWEEGLASFLEMLLVDVYNGDPDLAAVERDAREIRQRLRRDFQRNAEAAATPMIGYGRGDITGFSYRVGMLGFGVLYHRVGQETFNRIIGGFFQQYRTTGASTDQFIEWAKQTASADLESFFDDWFYTTGFQRFLDSDLTLAQIADSYD